MQNWGDMEAGREVPAGAPRGLSRKRFLGGSSVAVLGLWAFGPTAAGATSRATAPSTAAPGPKTRGGVLRFSSGLFTPQDSLDPTKNIGDLQDIVQAMIAEALVTPDWDFNPSPRLAASWEASDDFREWTFTLREGVKFHDGRPFSAEDVAFTLRRLIDPDTGSGLYARLSASLSESGIVAVDDHTLRLELLRPDSLILLPFSNPGAYIVPAGTTGTDFEKGIGTGAFRIKSWDPGRSFEVERNPDYWGPPAYLDGVRGTNVPEASTRAQSLLAGTTDFIELDYSALPTVEGNDSVRIERAEGQQFLNVVMDSTQAPFDDPNVRKAIQLAVNRMRVRSVAYHDFATVTADVPTVPSSAQFPPELEHLLEPDLALSQQLLADAGYPDGLDLTLKVSGVALDTSFALAVADALLESNVRVEVERHPSATYWDEVWLHDSFYVSTWNRRAPIEALTAMFKSDAPWNESRLASPELDELIERALTLGGDDLTDVMHQALTIVGDFGGMLIPAIRDRLWLVRSEVADFVTSPQGLVDLRAAALS